MKSSNNTGRKYVVLLFSLILMSFAGLSCSDEVDESNLYVFTGEQATDYIASQPELSKYLVFAQESKVGQERLHHGPHARSTRKLYLLRAHQ